jgi:hypothetical protein
VSERPVEDYLRQLEDELRVPRATRRRILAEVREHLLDDVAAESVTEGLAGAQQRAVERFGGARETAGQLNRLRRGTVLVRRALLPAVAALGLTSLASATVWASGTHSGSRPHARTSAPGAARPAGTSPCPRPRGAGRVHDGTREHPDCRPLARGG